MILKSCIALESKAYGNFGGLWEFGMGSNLRDAGNKWNGVPIKGYSGFHF